MLGPAAHSIAPTSAGLASPSTQRAFAVHLGPVAYALAWASIYLFHVACTLYCAAAAVLFRATQQTPTVQVLDADGAILSPLFFPTVAIAHYVVGAVHACFIVAPIVQGFYRIITRRFSRRPSRTASIVMSRLKSVRLPKSIEQYVPLRFRHTARTIYARVFARQGLFGIESQQFDSLLLVREMLECALQTYQAYQMCQSLPRKWLNRVFVATLVANCWVTPVLYHLVKNEPLRRLLDRLCDVALDFLAAVGVPVVLVASYAQYWDAESRGFPSLYWNDELWFATLRSEGPLVFFGSWIDALSRLVFSIGLLLSLDDIKILLKRRRTSVGAVKPHPTVQVTTPKTARGAHRALRLGHGVLFGFGVVILGIHLHSELRTRPQACILELNPWFVPKPTCVIVEFNCYTNRDFTGNAHEFDSVFGNLVPTRLEKIRFRHCPSIDVLPSIQQFPNVGSIRFYNSTVRSWGADAALTNASHPKLLDLYVIRSNLPNGSIPNGLLSRDFPRGVVDIIFSVTNIQHIPDDLDESWPPGLALCLEFSPLAEFPLVFTRLQVVVLTLVGNQITEVPPEAFEVTDQATLGLSGNPITFLPDDVMFESGVFTILLYSTNLVDVPAWLLDAAAMGVYVTAGRTPYCEQVLADATASESFLDTASESSSDTASDSSSGSGFMEEPAWPIIDCMDVGPVSGAYLDTNDVRESEVW